MTQKTFIHDRAAVALFIVSAACTALLIITAWKMDYVLSTIAIVAVLWFLGSLRWLPGRSNMSWAVSYGAVTGMFVGVFGSFAFANIFYS